MQIVAVAAAFESLLRCTNRVAQSLVVQAECQNQGSTVKCSTSRLGQDGIIMVVQTWGTFRVVRKVAQLFWSKYTMECNELDPIRY